MGLFERAATLPKAEPRVHAQMLLDWGMAMAEAGDVAGAGSRAAAAMEAAVELGDRGLMARARLLRLDIHMVDGTYEGSDQRITAEQDLALADAEAAGDEIAMADALSSKSFTAWNSGLVALQDVLSAALWTTPDEQATVAWSWRSSAICSSPTSPGRLRYRWSSRPVSSCLPMPQTIQAWPLSRRRCWQSARPGSATSSKRVCTRTRPSRPWRTCAQVIHAAHVRTYRAWVERIAGDPVAAEAILRTALDEARNAGEAAQESFVACRIAEALVAQGRHDDAAAMLAIAERYPVAATSSRILGAWARIHADRGERETAVLEVERLVAGANDIWPNVACDAYVDAAEATLAMGDATTAAGYAREAMRCAAMKGIVARDPQLKDLPRRAARHPEPAQPVGSRSLAIRFQGV